MKTTTITPSNTDLQADRRSGRFGRYLRKVTAAAALAASVGVGLSVVAAAPASAATQVGYCFVTADGRPAAGLTTTYNVLLTNGNYQPIGTSRTGSSGCDIIDTRAWSNYYIRVSAGTFGGRYVGWTPYVSAPGYGYSPIGTGVVRMLW
jgi:hypothetical protein